MPRFEHQYVERDTRAVRTEALRGDRLVRALYSRRLERAPWLCRAASSARLTAALAHVSYDSLLGARVSGATRFARECGVDLSECVESQEFYDTPRKVFERQIRYWERRPLPEDERVVVSPADSRVLVGSLGETSMLFVKEKFFDDAELLGEDRARWLRIFAGGDFAVFRLTPEKYHYTHVPASGEVVDVYALEGRYHSCNPSALISLVSAHSKNRRVVTVIDTDVQGGSYVGMIAMIEIVALMVGRIEERYSEEHYTSPQTVRAGMLLKRGQPKGLFRPGSSTVILLFEPGRVCFAADLLANQCRADVRSRFSLGLKQTLVETDVLVRSFIAAPLPAADAKEIVL